MLAAFVGNLDYDMEMRMTRQRFGLRDISIRSTRPPPPPTITALGPSSPLMIMDLGHHGHYRK